MSRCSRPVGQVHDSLTQRGPLLVPGVEVGRVDQAGGRQALPDVRTAVRRGAEDAQELAVEQVVIDGDAIHSDRVLLLHERHHERDDEPEHRQEE